MANLTPTFITELMVQSYKRGKQDASTTPSAVEERIANGINEYFARRSVGNYGPAVPHFNESTTDFERGLCAHLLHHLGLT